MTTYPAQIDSTSLPLAVDNKTPVSASIVNNLRGAIIATEQTLGVNPGAGFGTVAARMAHLETSAGSSIQLAKDLGGTRTVPLVVGIYGNPVSSISPTVGQNLQWDGSYWTPTSGSSPSGTASGDLSGTYPNPLVASITPAAATGTVGSNLIITPQPGTPSGGNVQGGNAVISLQTPTGSGTEAGLIVQRGATQAMYIGAGSFGTGWTGMWLTPTGATRDNTNYTVLSNGTTTYVTGPTGVAFGVGSTLYAAVAASTFRPTDDVEGTYPASLGTSSYRWTMLYTQSGLDAGTSTSGGGADFYIQSESALASGSYSGGDIRLWLGKPSGEASYGKIKFYNYTGGAVQPWLTLSQGAMTPPDITMSLGRINNRFYAAYIRYGIDAGTSTLGTGIDLVLKSEAAKAGSNANGGGIDLVCGMPDGSGSYGMTNIQLDGYGTIMSFGLQSHLGVYYTAISIPNIDANSHPFAIGYASVAPAGKVGGNIRIASQDGDSVSTDGGQLKIASGGSTGGTSGSITIQPGTSTLGDGYTGAVYLKTNKTAITLVPSTTTASCIRLTNLTSAAYVYTDSSGNLLAGSSAAGGDLSGTYPNPLVVSITPAAAVGMTGSDLIITPQPGTPSGGTVTGGNAVIALQAPTGAGTEAGLQVSRGGQLYAQIGPYESTYSAVWLAPNITPTQTNFVFLGNATSTYLNVSSGGTTVLSVSGSGAYGLAMTTSGAHATSFRPAENLTTTLGDTTHRYTSLYTGQVIQGAANTILSDGYTGATTNDASVYTIYTDTALGASQTWDYVITVVGNDPTDGYGYRCDFSFTVQRILTASATYLGATPVPLNVRASAGASGWGGAAIALATNNVTITVQGIAGMTIDWSAAIQRVAVS